MLGYVAGSALGWIKVKTADWREANGERYNFSINLDKPPLNGRMSTPRTERRRHSLSDDQNQRSEFDDFLVVLRRLQKATPAPASIEAAETASMDIQAMIHKGVAMPAHLRIRAQLEERLAQLRRCSK
jgi:hypothetical protein